MVNSYLQHYGILGMKWGVRRYQNKDGSLTSAGKKRYGDDSKTGGGNPKRKVDTARKVRNTLATVAIAYGIAHQFQAERILSQIGSQTISSLSSSSSVLRGMEEVERIFNT